MTDIEKPRKKRATPQEQKAALEAKIKALEVRQEVLDKRLLLRFADEISALAKRRASQPTIGQAATMLSQAAAAIKAEIPQ
jgi:hypothetical protein